MKLLFSEARPEYEQYIFPYAIWAFPENGETPADLFNAGFLPSTRTLDRFYMARQIRVRLQDFKVSSENRRILRKCDHLRMRILPQSEFTLTPDRLEFCRTYANSRFGDGVMSSERLESLFTAPVATHIMVFDDPSNGVEAGYVVLYLEANCVAFYYYSFYDIALIDRSLGLYLMTSAVKAFAEAGFSYLYLGTCYSERALYKTQFRGCEFFNAVRWSTQMQELKYLVARSGQTIAGHLLENQDYLQSYYRTDPAGIARDFGLHISTATSKP